MVVVLNIRGRIVAIAVLVSASTQYMLWNVRQPWTRRDICFAGQNASPEAIGHIQKYSFAIHFFGIAEVSLECAGLRG